MPFGHERKASFLIDAGNGDRLLIVAHPPNDRFFFRDAFQLCNRGAEDRRQLLFTGWLSK